MTTHLVIVNYLHWNLFACCLFPQHIWQRLQEYSGFPTLQKSKKGDKYLHMHTCTLCKCILNLNKKLHAVLLKILL